jgi:hypothetical protein
VVPHRVPVYAIEVCKITFEESTLAECEALAIAADEHGSYYWFLVSSEALPVNVRVHSVALRRRRICFEFVTLALRHVEAFLAKLYVIADLAHKSNPPNRVHPTPSAPRILV